MLARFLPRVVTKMKLNLLPALAGVLGLAPIAAQSIDAARVVVRPKLPWVQPASNPAWVPELPVACTM